jgi:hypothetical protein
MPGTVADGPTVSMSCTTSITDPAVNLDAANAFNPIVANNFWGKEDAGVGPMLDRMHSAKVSCDELKTFYNSAFLSFNLFMENAKIS